MRGFTRHISLWRCFRGGFVIKILGVWTTTCHPSSKTRTQRDTHRNVLAPSEVYSLSDCDCDWSDWEVPVIAEITGAIKIVQVGRRELHRLQGDPAPGGSTREA